jgi:OOP family OmpA-OmpF porin
VAKGPSDDDKDGVTNDLDQCPDTPAGVAVGPNGCPADSDGDGVADYLDKCPGTPAGASVDADGCPTDSDKDGVFDYLDQCANTPFGAKVDDRGCWTLENVGFKVNKADLTPEVKIKMKNVLDVLKKNPELKVSVEGHTDSTGSVTLNQKLSEKRAQAIKKYIIDSGISADRVVSAGFGLSKPIADNKTEAGRAKNRRVEIRPLN